ncbi:MAG: hypothetical protein R3A11_09390 [Bdellovibrionota bacterium]
MKRRSTKHTTRFHHSSKGMAVILVLILIVSGIGMFMAMNNDNIIMTRLGGFFKRSYDLKLEAESGLEIQRAELMTLARNCMDNKYDGDSKATFTTPEDENDDVVALGYVYDADRPDVTPVISRSRGDINLRVFLFPEDPDPAIDWTTSPTEYDLSFPKYFLVVSETENEKTGEIFTIESRVKIREESYSEILYGTHGVGAFPVLKPSEYYKIAAGIFEGRVHFGDFPDGKLQFEGKWWEAETGTSWNQSLPGSPTQEEQLEDGFEFTNQVHYFLGHVTFADPVLPGDEYPFKRREVDMTSTNCSGGCGSGEYKTEMYFAEGYTANYTNIRPVPSTYYTDVETKATVDLSSLGLTDVCLKLVSTPSGGKIKQYNCATDEFFAFDRYQNEQNDVINGTDSSIATYDTDGLFTCLSGSCNVHIKGIVDGEATFAADNIYIEGDLVYQDPNEDVLGVVAKNNIVIPEAVPQTTNPYETLEGKKPKNVDRYDPTDRSTANGQYLDITNFIPVDSDGNLVDPDIEDTTYPSQWMEEGLTSIGYVNAAAALDLEGHFLAGEHVVISGIFNPEVDSAGGLAVWATADGGATYQQYVGSGKDTLDSFYMTNPLKPTKTIAKPGLIPPYYYDGYQPTLTPTDTAGAYDQFEEMIRSVGSDLRVRGSLNSKYSYTANTFNGRDQGFQRRVIRPDPRVAFNPPDYYPPTGEMVIGVEFQKSYRGRNKRVPAS